MHQEVLEYIQKNRDRFLEELLCWLRIPSISTDRQYREEVLNSARYLKEQLAAIGIENIQLIPSEGFPVVYGEKIINPALPTVLIYGHYDVQPPDPLELWNSPPFEPVIKDEKIYARGACDDKGQVYMHIKAVETLLKLNKLPCNVKFFIEGEEEIGSASLPGVLAAHKDLLQCDTILISDTSMVSLEQPSITTSLRGLAYVEVEVTGPNRDLHSGVYGGAIDNPIFRLCKMIASLKDENERITIPGFYDDVKELTLLERRMLAEVPFDYANYLLELDIRATRGESGYTALEQLTIRPTLEVNGIWGGYTGEGSKTVIPSKAYAKISMRLVPYQDSEKITALFKKHFESLAPPSVKVEVRPHHGGNPYISDINSVSYRAAAAAIKQSFGKEPIASREGGSIPILAEFDKVLKKPIVLLGFGLDTDAIHSPNEHYGVKNYFKGIETICLFYYHFAILSRN
ncbi:MAG: dipeptidase [Bacteroidia bacterium]|nr:dipeptidase [Bacteroidia bacterium]MDW8157829.1 dipeptidase [Bacteroidia bacterium]